MEKMFKVKVFLIYCRACGHAHRMTMQPCLTCQGRGGQIPMPVSERVYEACGSNYSCADCEAYNEQAQ